MGQQIYLETCNSHNQPEGFQFLSYPWLCSGQMHQQSDRHISQGSLFLPSGLIPHSQDPSESKLAPGMGNVYPKK